MRRYLYSMGAIAALYILNRSVLIPASSGTLRVLLGWYFADFLAGGLMLCILNTLMTASERPALTHPLPASAFLLSCGIFWEYVTPLYLARSVSDPWDILAVWLGGLGMLLLQRHWNTRL